MKKTTMLLAALCLFSTARSENPGQPLPRLGKDRIESVIGALTLEEKISLLMGIGGQIWSNPLEGEKTVTLPGAAGRTYQVERLGITHVMMTDGPAGVHISERPDGESGPARYCTAFPIGTALAATWNPTVVERVGRAMGHEAKEYGSDVMLTPALNIHRNPLCGRNFEYYSEDPLIAGRMAGALVTGLQEEGVSPGLKHFAANNSETNRMTMNSVISQRALREIYLRGFEIAVKESKPWTVMSSYNRLNGRYTSENPDLITAILRDEWGFEGLVMTDWGGGADAVAQMEAGNDLLMPGNHQKEVLLHAIRTGKLDESTIDRNLKRMLEFIRKTARFNGFVPSYRPDLKADAAVSREAAGEAIVLLKNDRDALPLKKAKSVALFGKTSYNFIAGGTGSGDVNYEHAATIEEGLREAGYSVPETLRTLYGQFTDSVSANFSPGDQWYLQFPKFAVGYHAEMPVSRNLIGEQARRADAAVITIGRFSGEGWDRSEEDYFLLSQTEKDLIRNVSEAFRQAGKRVIVVLNVPGPIDVSQWRDDADAIVVAWQTGQEGGRAVADVLSGRINPSGKLASTFPMAYGDDPSAQYFPGEPRENPVDALYNEGIYVGYRYYSSFDVPVAYEFGYGKSYTTFEYSGLQIDRDRFIDRIEARITVKNTGKTAGKEVVQLYVAAPQQGIEKPVQELRGFAKTGLLAPGESEELTFVLDARSIASFWTGKSAWIAEKGTYEIRAGASSKDIRATKRFDVPYDITVERVHPVLYPDRVLNELSRK